MTNEQSAYLSIGIAKGLTEAVLRLHLDQSGELETASVLLAQASMHMETAAKQMRNAGKEP
jgi:hypothetical protein